MKKIGVREDGAKDKINGWRGPGWSALKVEREGE